MLVIQQVCIEVLSRVGHCSGRRDTAANNTDKSPCQSWWGWGTDSKRINGVAHVIG